MDKLCVLDTRKRRRDQICFRFDIWTRAEDLYFNFRLSNPKLFFLLFIPKRDLVFNSQTLKTESDKNTKMD